MRPKPKHQDDPRPREIGELCSGCGAVAPSHPIRGVARDEETGMMTAYPICAACHRDPSHRQRTLKMHYFDKDSAPQAVEDAENNILSDQP